MKHKEIIHTEGQNKVYDLFGLILISIILISVIIVLYGWLSNSLFLIQFSSKLLPMQFNTALVFLLCGMSYIGLVINANKLVKSTAILAFFISFLTFLQYPLTLNLGIDTFFIYPFTDLHLLYPGRMTLNTSIALTLLTTSLILSTLHTNISRLNVLIIMSFTSITFVLGITPILGYIAGIETTFPWGNFKHHMAVHTAYCTVFLSFAVILHTWKLGPKSSILIPIPIFIALTTISFLIVGATYDKEMSNLNKELKNTAQSAAQLTQQTLTNLIEALILMANRWEMSGQTPKQLWEADAQGYIKDFKYLTTLELLDSNLFIQYIEPYAQYKNLIGKNLNNDRRRKKLTQVAIKSHKPIISDIITLKQGGTGFLCFLPLFSEGRFSGMIVAVFRAKDFFATIYDHPQFSSYNINVYQDENLIFTNTSSVDALPSQTHQQSLIKSQNVNWLIKLYPIPTTLKKIINSAQFFGGIGILLSLLISLCSYLILRTLEKSKELIDSEVRYKMIVDGVQDYAIFMLNIEGKVKSWNSSAKKILGYSDAEIIGAHFSIFFPQDELSENTILSLLNKIKKAGKYEREGLAIPKDGNSFWANLLIDILRDNNRIPVGFVIIIRDSSERHQLEIERSKLVTLIDESSDFIGMADLEGNLEYHNRSSRLMIGLPADYDLSQMNIADIHPEWATKLILEQGIPTVYEKGVWTAETAILHRNGMEIPVLQSINLHRDASGKPLYFTTTMRDITERIAQEQVLRNSEELFRSAMQYAAIGIALVSPEGKWLKVNQALCTMLGYQPEELLKIDFQSISHPDDLVEDLQYLNQMLAKKIESYHMEKRYYHKDGSIIWGLLSVSLLANPDGTPKYFIAQIQNISDRKASEEANMKLLKALSKSNQELERFAYVASHDLQEPVRMINNFGTILLNEKQNFLDTEAKEYLGIITDAGKRMGDMIYDLLTYSRLGQETINFITFNAESVFAAVLENLKTLIDEKKATIVHDQLPELYGNPIQFMRLLQNLITNAIKYQPNTHQPYIQIGVKEEVNHWMFWVKDNGLGIENQFIHEIFEPFRRLHSWEKIKGSGLGLSICKKIVEIHGGTLWVKSTLGEGSIFFFKIAKRIDH